MADSIVRLKVDSTEYDSKIRRAAEGLQHFEQECRRVGGTLEYVEKEDLAFVKALGQMQTVATNSRQKMMEFTTAINDLSIQYKGLTDAEKQSPYGQALSASIDQLKARAGELKDRIADTNAELRNLASDTAFTDGIGMMTKTIGACASAMAAWGGKSQTMEEMIKSLAKIQTTVGAVEALTKAFQKQNLVLLKNPYVAAAAGVAALTMAIVKLAQKANEPTEAMKELQETMNQYASKTSSAVGDIVSQYKSMQAAWTSLSTAQEKADWLEKNKSALERMGLAADDVNAADRIFITQSGAVINALMKRAQAQAAQEAYAEKIKKAYEDAGKVETRIASGKNGGATEREKTAAGITAADYNYSVQGSAAGTSTTVANGLNESGMAKLNAYYEQQAQAERERIIKQGVDAADAYFGSFIAESQAQAAKAEAEVSDLLAKPTSKGEKAVKTKAKADAATFKFGNGSGMPEAGSLADLEAQAQTVRNSMSGALNADEYLEMAAYLQTIEDKIKAIKGEKEQTFAPGSLNALNEELRNAQNELANIAVGADGWAEALERVRTAQEAVNTAQGKVANNAATTNDLWQAAAQAISAAGSAMSAIEDPAAKVAGIVAQACASIMLGFAQAAASPATGTLGVFGWIAASLSGLATAIGMVSSIKSVTSGFAEGGMILPDGSPYQGDNIVARLNAGEGVLTPKGIATAEQLQGSASVAVAGGTLSTRIKGGDIIVALDNTNRSRGGSRGTYAYSK